MQGECSNRLYHHRGRSMKYVLIIKPSSTEPYIFLFELNEAWRVNSELWFTVKHVYNDHAYNEMTLIRKHLGIPGKHSIYFFINFTLTVKLHITKSHL